MKRAIMIIGLISLSVVGLFLFSQSILHARPPAAEDEAISAAASLYEAGQYEQAARSYQQLVNQGFSDSALYYNLGNAYFKQGDLGRAILNYRRAQRLAPRDADVKTNLALARALATDQLEETASDQSLFIQLGRATQTWLTSNELALGVLSVWIVLVCLVIAFISSKGGSVLREGLQYALIVSSLTMVVGVLSLASRMYLENERPEAVVVAQEIDITSGPGPQYVNEFDLHSGTEVALMETRGSWTRLSLSGDELQGWVPSSAVEPLALPE